MIRSFTTGLGKWYALKSLTLDSIWLVHSVCLFSIHIYNLNMSIQVKPNAATPSLAFKGTIK